MFRFQWLKRHDVTLLDEQRIVLLCDNCGITWSPNLKKQGQNAHGLLEVSESL